MNPLEIVVGAVEIVAACVIAVLPTVLKGILMPAAPEYQALAAKIDAATAQIPTVVADEVKAQLAAQTAANAQANADNLKVIGDSVDRLVAATADPNAPVADPNAAGA